jgi:hypothetical protein
VKVLALSACVAVVLIAGAFALMSDSSSDPRLLSPRSLKASGITSKAEWFASNPRTTVAQIAMACDMPIAKARSYNQRLAPPFDASTLSDLRSDCKG